MHRGKKIIYTAHCILNQNSVIRDWERAEGAFNDFIRVLLDYNISIIQLPCPEFIFLGEARPPMTKNDYDIPKYRHLCKALVENVIKQMKEYLAYEYKIIGLLGIKNSPTCDTKDNKGVFMKELFHRLNYENIKLRTFDVPEEYVEGGSKETLIYFKKFIRDSYSE